MHVEMSEKEEVEKKKKTGRQQTTACWYVISSMTVGPVARVFRPMSNSLIKRIVYVARNLNPRKVAVFSAFRVSIAGQGKALSAVSRKKS